MVITVGETAVPMTIWRRTAVANHQEVIRMPSQPLGLKADLDYDRVGQDGRDTMYQKLCEPVRIYVLFEGRPGATGRYGLETRLSFVVSAIDDR
jgi:hypothetical protein